MSDIKDLLKTVRELEIKTKGLVDGIVSGSYKSKIRGRGIEFSEVREYAIGDDIPDSYTHLTLPTIYSV